MNPMKRIMERRTWVLAAVASLGFWLLATGAVAGPPGLDQRDESFGVAYAEMDGGAAPMLVDRQVDDGGDSRVDVQVWTIIVVSGGAAVGLLLLVVRMMMGWTKAPPSQEDGEH